MPALNWGRDLEAVTLTHDERCALLWAICLAFGDDDVSEDVCGPWSKNAAGMLLDDARMKLEGLADKKVRA
jgi:hypothetical protein